jgi:RHS repeat-associated protein
VLLFYWDSPAEAQGDTRYDVGFNLPFNEKAGNVNPQTGNVTLSFSDLELPGRGGMNFQFGRYWNLNQANVFTMYRDPYDGSNKLNSETLEDCNHLGVGWSGTIPYIFADNSSGVKVLNLSFGGNIYQLDQSGLALYRSKINPDKSNILWYDLLDLRVYQEYGIKYEDYPLYYQLLQVEEYDLAYQPTMANEHLLILKDNSKYWFRPDGKLMMQEDRTGLNQIWYFYDSKAQLRLVVDTAERMIRFNYDNYGNLTTIEWDVIIGVKNADGQRTLTTETRRITYHYQSAEALGKVKELKPWVVGYKEPFLLVGVTDPEGNFTRYTYQEGPAYFTYDSAATRSRNLYMLLTEITAMEDAQGRYRNKQNFEYEVPAQGLYTREFYQGYFEYYKISRQYFQDRHGRIMNNTTYQYFDLGEAGNYHQYTTILRQGNLKTTYVYSVSEERRRDHVLEKMIIESADGFLEQRDYVYDINRAKILEEVYRRQFVYRERYQYDRKGNLKEHQDKIGLVTVIAYDDKYSIPRHIVKKVKADGVAKEYETEYLIDDLGQVIKELLYLEEDSGAKRQVIQKELEYDQYGNIIKVTDAHGNSVHTVYDLVHQVFPIKVFQDVTVESWQEGGTIDNNWFTEPDDTKKIRVRNWKVFNSDGTIWLELDNEGYALEHYYDKNKTEIETVLPDADDLRSFAEPITVVNNQPQGADFDDFLTSTYCEAFLESRLNNPKVRREISYTDDFIKTYTDLDVKSGAVKVTGEQGDGLGNIEEEIEYDAYGNRYAVKQMTYDLFGRLVGLTDPDAKESYGTFRVNGVAVEKFDKTWITEYDDLGREKWIYYPETERGRTDTKRFQYDDQQNNVTITDALGRRVMEQYDWNGNLIKTIRYGERTTPSTDWQEYRYEYDELNRLISFTDPIGNVTGYRYDERDLLLEERHGTTGNERMEYNDLGLLVQKTDRKGQIIVMEYDEMNRNTAVLHYQNKQDYQNNQACRQVKTVYDHRGNPVRVSSEELIEYYLYDHSNQVIKLERRLKDPALREQVARVWGGDAEEQSFNFSYEYNDAGMVTRMIYPDGAVHQYDYDSALGRLEQIKTVIDPDSWLAAGGSHLDINPFVTRLEYTPSGVVTEMEYANQTKQTWDFDHRKRISRIQISAPGTMLEDLSYKVDAVGNIRAINENEYTYDGFDRIAEAKTILPGNADQKKLVAKHFGTYKTGVLLNGIGYLAEADLNGDGRINGIDHTLASFLSDDQTYDQESFSYDINGNRTKLMQNGDLYTYQYGERNRLEAVYLQRKEAANARLFMKYTYDANGNTIERIIYTDTGEVKTEIEYDTLNRVVRTTEGGKVTEYLYDNVGNRFVKKGPEGTILYLRHGQIAVAMDIKMLVDETECMGKINRYVLSGALLAGRITQTVKGDGIKEIKTSYYHLDYLNSTKLVSDESGEVEVRYIYRAFGEQLAKLGTGEAKYTYGGKELDNETNLYYVNARYYDAVIGRFISEDPARDGTNWYVYADNNPLRSVDPTGLKEVRITTTYECSIHSMDLQQFKNWSVYKENRLKDISDSDKKNTFGGIGAGAGVSLVTLKCPPLGIIAGGVAAFVIAEKDYELKNNKENIDSVHNRLFASFTNEKVSEVSFSLYRESLTERVTKGNTTQGNTIHDYYVEFIDGRTKIDKETYEYLFDNTQINKWEWSSKNYEEKNL